MHVATTSRNSKIAALLVNQDKVFSLEQKSPDVFAAVVEAAKTGTPRSLLTVAKTTLDEAFNKGEVLSPRSSELRQLVTESLRVPALFRAQFH